jgi:hypothetical protein
MGVENYRPGHSASSAWDSDPSAPSPMLARGEAFFGGSDRRCVEKNRLEKTRLESRANREYFLT